MTGRGAASLRIGAGAFSAEPFVHDHWEEVYVVKGDLVVGNDERGKGGEQCFASFTKSILRNVRRTVIRREQC